jgi:hypothetical protein
VARWKARADVADLFTRQHRLATAINEWEEALILELRRSLVLPLDDIVEVIRCCLNPKLWRSSVHAASNSAAFSVASPRNPRRLCRLRLGERRNPHPPHQTLCVLAVDQMPLGPPLSDSRARAASHRTAR